MAEYKSYINALKQCAKEHKNDRTPTFQIRVSDLCEDTARLLENDVIERSKIDKAIEEIEDLDPITERVGLQVKQEILNILKSNIGE